MPSKTGPSDLKSLCFTSIIKDIYLQNVYVQQPLFIRGSIQIQQKWDTLLKVSLSFHLIGILSHYFLQVELSQRFLHNAHLSQRQRQPVHFVLRAQTWVRANMVLYWLPATGTFSTDSEICVFTKKHAQALYTAYP